MPLMFDIMDEGKVAWEHCMSRSLVFSSSRKSVSNLTIFCVGVGVELYLNVEVLLVIPATTEYSLLQD